MALELVITNAGRAALIAAANDGTNAVRIASVGVSPTAIVAAAATAVLPGEVKRIGTISGGAVADDTIHVTVRDESADAYSTRSIALYLQDGTLFACYGQPTVIAEKSAQAMLLLALDVQLVDVDAENITFGDANFLNPPATTETAGVVELATDAEASAGADAQRAVTPKGLSFALTAKLANWGADVWRASNDGAGSGLDADLLDGRHAADFALLSGATFQGSIVGTGTPNFIARGASPYYAWYDATGASRLGYLQHAANNLVMNNDVAGGFIQLNASGKSLIVSSTGVNVTGTLSQGGQAVWHAGNLTPGNYALLSGATFTGAVQATTFRSSKLTVIPMANPTTAAGVTQIELGESTDNASFRLKLGYWFTGATYQGAIDATAGGAPTVLNIQPTGGNAVFGGAVAAAGATLTSATEEKLQLRGSNSPLFAAYNAAATRLGFIQFDATNAYLGHDTGNVRLYSNGSPILTASGAGVSVTGGLTATAAASGAGGWYMAGQFQAPAAPMIRLGATTANKWASIGNDSDGSLYFFVNGSSGVTGTAALSLLPTGAALFSVGPSITAGYGLYSGSAIMLSGDGGGTTYIHSGASRVAFRNAANNAEVASISNGGALSAASATFTGNVYSSAIVGAGTTGVGGSGTAVLNPGSGANSGYLALHKGDGTRMGYIGFIPAAGGDMQFIAENGTSGFNFSGAPLMQDGAAVWTSANFDPATKANAAHTHAIADVTGLQGALDAKAPLASPNFSGTVTRAGNQVWDAGNDGAGSGLDADLLDGRHAADFALLSDFANNLTGIGYQRLPGGLILQWCAGAGGSAGYESTQGVNFPIAFPNACLHAQVTTRLSSGTTAGDAFWQLVGSPTTTGATVQRQITGSPSDSAFSQPYVFAIGY